MNKDIMNYGQSRKNKIFKNIIRNKYGDVGPYFVKSTSGVTRHFAYIRDSVPQ